MLKILNTGSNLRLNFLGYRSNKIIIFSYETSNGILAEEVGHLNNLGSENEALSVSGSFKYVAPDGVTYSISYIADENGFQPQGEHLPH